MNKDLEKTVENKILFHGSKTTGINQFKGAEEYTLAKGLYLTSKFKWGKYYAQLRTCHLDSPTVYVVKVDGLKFMNIRSKENFDYFLSLVKETFKEGYQEHIDELKAMEEVLEENRLIEKIDNTIHFISSNEFDPELVELSEKYKVRKLCNSELLKK